VIVLYLGLSYDSSIKTKSDALQYPDVWRNIVYGTDLASLCRNMEKRFLQTLTAKIAFAGKNCLVHLSFFVNNLQNDVKYNKIILKE